MKQAIFNTQGADSKLRKYDGSTVDVLRPPTEKEADLIETGPMFKIRLPDGIESEAFGDELTPLGDLGRC